MWVGSSYSWVAGSGNSYLLQEPYQSQEYGTLGTLLWRGSEECCTHLLSLLCEHKANDYAISATNTITSLSLISVQDGWCHTLCTWPESGTKFWVTSK